MKSEPSDQGRHRCTQERHGDHHRGVVTGHALEQRHERGRGDAAQHDEGRARGDRSGTVNAHAVAPVVRSSR